MLVVIPFCHKDKDAALRLLEWIGQLGANNWHHTVLFVTSATVERSELLYLMHPAKGIFGGVLGVKQNQSDDREWPCNGMFRTTLDYIEQQACVSFLWCEPDCVPLVPDWLSQIHEAYEKCGKLVMGALHEKPTPHIASCAVYPPNFREINPEAVKATKQRWDLVRPEITLAAAHPTNLIQHVWGEGNTPPSFNGEKSFEIVSKDAVLFHRCKDGTLIDASRKRLGIGQAVGKSIIIRRTGAFGDAISASAVATRFQELGYSVTFQAHPSIHPILRRVVPKIAVVSEIERFCHIDLDEAYERDPNRRKRPMAYCYFDVANKQAEKQRITGIGRARNYAPRIEIKDAEKRAWLHKLSQAPRPWTMICPRSNSHRCRQVPDDIWQKAAKDIDGSKFWLGSHAPAPAGIVDLKCKSMEEITGALSVADLMLTTDTGPMHIAAAMNIPIVVVEQATSTDYTLSDQCDWSKVKPPLNCLNCQDTTCRIKPSDPPCQYIDPILISTAANRRLRVQDTDVSIVVAIYKPTVERLNRCLTAALPQCKEILVVSDRAGIVPDGALRHEKIQYARSWQTDIGYGRKANFGMRHTVSRWVLLLNDDCYLSDNAIAKLMECARPDVGMVSACLFYPTGKIQHGGTIRAPGQHGWHHLDVGQDKSRFTDVVEMENVTGACVMINREAFYTAGGFDENFYLCCEDNDMCMRIRKAGYRILFTPHATAIHEESVSSRTTPGFQGIVKESCTYLEKKWGWYWEKNRNVELGTF
jgi:GT2 family glycosyltransferase/ADP-heptose:LPS heptosyltransferase